MTMMSRDDDISLRTLTGISSEEKKEVLSIGKYRVSILFESL